MEVKLTFHYDQEENSKSMIPSTCLTHFVDLFLLI
jgi:hypothetical protein